MEKHGGDLPYIGYTDTVVDISQGKYQKVVGYNGRHICKPKQRVICEHTLKK